MRDIKFIAVHCTATQPETSIQTIQKYWQEVLKWKTPGYHFIVEANGKVTELLPVAKVSNGVAGYNSITINVSYIGGIDKEGKPKDTRTLAQKISLQELLEDIKEHYPNAVIQGHKDFPKVSKECPSFDAKKEYKDI